MPDLPTQAAEAGKLVGQLDALDLPGDVTRGAELCAALVRLAQQIARAGDLPLASTYSAVAAEASARVAQASPPHGRVTHTWILGAHASLLSDGRRLDEARRFLDEAVTTLNEQDLVDPAMWDGRRAEVMLVSALCYYRQGRLPEALDHAEASGFATRGFDQPVQRVVEMIGAGFDLLIRKPDGLLSIVP